MRPRRAEPHRRRAAGPGRGGIAPFVRFLLVWIVSTWSVIGALLAPVVPGDWLAVAAALLVTTAPLAVMLAARRRGHHPGALFRLLVLRPFWYAQILLPVLAIAGLLGALAGAPFGAAGAAGRGAMLGAAALAAVAGLMATLYYGVIDFFIGFLAGVKAFTAAVLGGIGSIPGAMLGGLVLGLVEAFWSGYFTIQYKDVAAFSILVIVLIFLPTGLLGRPEIEKV